MNIALIGFGNVGQGLASILHEKADVLREKHGFDGKLVAVATGSNGTLYDADGLDIGALLELAQEADSSPYLAAYPDSPSLERDWDALRIVRESNADVIVEASPTNLETGQPALDLCRAAFDTGKHVVLANKGPVAVAYDDLRRRAKSANKRLMIEATVMSGTPSIRMAMQSLAGCEIQSIRGILNGTTNYILTEMEGDLDFESALAQAQALGYAETDPSGDVEGWDAAGKVIILAAALFGRALTLDDMDVRGITSITPDDIEAARVAGERWKLIATITPTEASVQPMRLPRTDPLANITGANNAITYSTDLMGDVTLIGAGAGRRETGFGLLSDLLNLNT